MAHITHLNKHVPLMASTVLTMFTDQVIEPRRPIFEAELENINRNSLIKLA